MMLDIPLDAHCLPGRGKRVDCNLPVIGVADEDEIQALMTSIVYQRHVLGISLPAVGISLSKLAPLQMLSLAGMKSRGNGFVCPRPIAHGLIDSFQLKVHLAYSLPGSSSLGSYNIADPTSALYFSRTPFLFGVNQR